MIKETMERTINEQGGFEIKNNLKKTLIIISMIIIGILVIAYRANFEYWSNQFIAYNQILFALSLVFFILILIILLKDLKDILKREFLGAVIFAVGVILLMLVPARNMIGVGEGSSGAFLAVGGIVVILGTIFLMRSGGYISVSLISLLTLMLVSAYHMFGSSDVIQYNENTFLITTYAIVFLILCYILLVYDDAKFFYLAKLIKDERNYRKKKEYKKAMSYCDRALLIYPYFATAWNNKGNVYMNMGKKDDARNCYEKALNINPNYEPAMMNLKVIKRF